MISRRQLLFLLAFLFPVSKLVMLPAALAEHAEGDLLLPAALHLLLQTGAVFCALLLAKRGQSFSELLENAFGRVFSRILLVLYALFLLFAGLLPILEQKLFVQAIFYDTLPSVAAFAPFFLFLAYVVSKPLPSYGRVWDILAPLSVAAYLGLIALAVGETDFGALLPVGASGAQGFFGGTMSASGWFYDAALLLPLLKKYEYKKGLAWKGALSYLGGGCAVLFFLAVFYGVYQGTAANRLFAIATVAQYFSGITMLGRVDYLFVFALSLTLAFLAAFPLQGAAECLLQAFGRKKYLPTVYGVVGSALFAVLAIVLDYRFGEVLLALAKVFWVFPLFSVAVPAFTLLFRRRHA